MRVKEVIAELKRVQPCWFPYLREAAQYSSCFLSWEPHPHVHARARYPSAPECLAARVWLLDPEPLGYVTILNIYYGARWSPGHGGKYTFAPEIRTRRYIEPCSPLETLLQFTGSLLEPRIVWDPQRVDP